MREIFFLLLSNYSHCCFLSSSFSLSVIVKSWSESIVMASSLLLSRSLRDWFTSSNSFTLLRISAPCLSNWCMFKKCEIRLYFPEYLCLFRFLLSPVGGNGMPNKILGIVCIPQVRNGGFHKSPK